MRIIGLALAAAVAVVVPATAAAQEGTRLDEKQALAVFEANPKVKSWLERYPPKPTTEVTFDQGTRQWRVKIWSGDAGQIADGKVDDATTAVLEAWTGPQVAWTMARGSPGAFGGKTINRSVVWFTFVGIFLLGLVDWRRPLTLRTLDLVGFASFSASLWYFNRGDVFTAMPLAYPPLVYLMARLAWIGWDGRAPRGRVVWPIWLLAAAAVFLTGFRIAINHSDSNVIDVGLSGVIGAQRLANGEMPYGNMPVGRGTPCGPKDANGNYADYIQTNARCERADERGDTYGPVAYLAYLPGYGLFGWSGRWDTLPAAHFTSVLFDVATLVGLVLVGLRFGGMRFAAILAFAWTAYPFTLYATNSNTNDTIMPAFLVWGFWLVSRPGARGALAALSGWTKFATMLLAPLWATYPGRRPSKRFIAGFVIASLAAFWFLLLEPRPIEAAQTFGERSLVWQIGRESPFSLWDWGQYHAAGIPDLHLGQRVLQVLVVLGAIAAAFFPRRKSPLQLAALTGALLAGFELVQTHWFYLYIPWFFPFAAIAVLAGDRAR